jgi:methionyl aminopeptidase
MLTNMIALKSKNELARMREAGRIVARAHEALREVIAPGITTAELDELADRVIRQQGAIPSFLGYPHSGKNDFPASVCTSINQEIVHGIPSSKRVLEEGDIISVDVGTIYKGWQGDAAFTVGVGRISPEAQRLIDVTEQALAEAIGQCLPGNRLWDVMSAVQRHAEAAGFSVIREYQGHGIGREMHEPPSVPNFVDENRRRRPKNWLLKPGMTLAIEPMVCQGGWQTRTLADGWTVVTLDGKLSAHSEHTVAVTENGPNILTQL